MKRERDCSRFGRVVRNIAISLTVLPQLLFVAASRADVFTNVPEAAGYQLVYVLNLPNAANYSGNAVPYAVDNHLNVTSPVERYLAALQPRRPRQLARENIPGEPEESARIAG
jgi:hypothetical protein